MSLSNKEREDNIVLAVHLIMQSLGEPYEWQELDATTEKFADVYRTTWDDLVERGLVKPSTFDRYSLTGDGWIAGLKVVGLFDGLNFREKAGQLSKALKARVKNGREWGYADRTELASEAGLSEFFIYDAIGLAPDNVVCIGGGNFVRVATAVTINVSGSLNRRFQRILITKTVKPATGLNLIVVDSFDNLAGKKFRLRLPIHLANRRNNPSCCLDVF